MLSAVYRRRVYLLLSATGVDKFLEPEASNDNDGL